MHLQVIIRFRHLLSRVFNQASFYSIEVAGNCWWLYEQHTFSWNWFSCEQHFHRNFMRDCSAKSYSWCWTEQTNVYPGECNTIQLVGTDDGGRNEDGYDVADGGDSDGDVLVNEWWYYIRCHLPWCCKMCICCSHCQITTCYQLTPSCCCQT